MRLLKEAEITRTELSYAVTHRQLYLRHVYGREEELLWGQDALEQLGAVLRRQQKRLLSERSNLFIPQPRALDDASEKWLLDAFLNCELRPVRMPRCKEGAYLLITPPADSTPLSSLSVHTRFGSAGLCTPCPEQDIHIVLALLHRALMQPLTSTHTHNGDAHAHPSAQVPTVRTARTGRRLADHSTQCRDRAGD